MPYEWLPTEPGKEALRLWPHRSLGARGFVLFISVTAALMAVPLLSLLGHGALWIILAFALVAIAAIWLALVRNSRDRDVTELLTFDKARISLVQTSPGRAERRWQANPYWVRLSLYATSGPVPHYLTLRGDGREVELGAFLTEEERKALAVELAARIDRQSGRGGQGAAVATVT